MDTVVLVIGIVALVIFGAIAFVGLWFHEPAKPPLEQKD